jgi:DNA-binding MarR family transcriptional regulator
MRRALNASQTRVLSAVTTAPGLTVKEISARVGLSPRTVRYCLDLLEAYDLIVGRPDFRDMRKLFYFAAPAEQAAQ